MKEDKQQRSCCSWVSWLALVLPNPTLTWARSGAGTCGARLNSGEIHTPLSGRAVTCRFPGESPFNQGDRLPEARL